jgi:HK97 family phage major capsid protein
VTLQELFAKLKEIDAALEKIVENDSLSEEQRADYERLAAERKKVADAIRLKQEQQARAADRADLEAAAERAEKREARKDKPGENRLTDPDPARRTAPDDGRPDISSEGYRIPARVRRAGSLKYFRGTKNGVPAEVRAYRFGMFMLGQLYRDLPNRYPRLRAAAEWSDKFLAASQSNDATGTQYLIPPEFGVDIIDLREKYGVVRRLFKMVQMASDTRTDPRRKGGLTAYSVAEGAAGTESNKVWDNVALVAKDIMVLSRYTRQVDMDAAISIGDDLAREIAYAYSIYEDDAGFNGDGTSTYSGIQGARTKMTNCDGAGGTSAGLVTAGTTGSWGAIVLSDFNNVAGKLPQYADDGDAVWVSHRAFYFSVMQKLELAAGGVTALEVAQGDRRPRPLFLGYPVEFAQKMPATTAASQIPVLLGNFALGAEFGDRQLDEISFSEQASIGGQSLWERGQIGIRGIERFDENVHDVGDTTNPGPIVGLTT